MMNDVKNEHRALLWKCKILTQTLDNKMPTPEGMETKNEIKIMEAITLPQNQLLFYSLFFSI